MYPFGENGVLNGPCADHRSRFYWISGYNRADRETSKILRKICADALRRMTRALVHRAPVGTPGGPVKRPALLLRLWSYSAVREVRWFEMGLIDWVLGLLTKRVEVRDRQQEIEQGIRTDLEKLAGRLVGLPFLISYRLGGLNKELTNWVADHYERYPDPNDDLELRARLEQWRNLSEEEISEVQRLGKTTWKGAFDVKKYSTPYLDTHIGEIQSLPKEFRQAVIETKEDLSLFNQRVDSARALLDKSFDSSISPENQQLLAGNLNDTYARLKDDAMRIVERIDGLPPP